MKNISQLLFLSFAFIFLFSCNNDKKLYDEVMAVHDDAMMKMDKIMNLKEQLKSKADSLKNDTTQDFSAELEKIRSLSNKLDSADESMMMWMREFHQDYETVAKEQVNEYLKRQKEKITQVGKFMNETIAETEKYLSE